MRVQVQFLVVLTIALAFARPSPSQAQSTAASMIVSPPNGKMYHSVYPGGRTGVEDDITLGDLQSYEQAVGKTAAWVYFSNNWYRDRRFPLSTANWIRDSGSIPFIRLMLRDSDAEGIPNQNFTLDRIIHGYLDEDLRAWARSARDFGSPLLVEYGTEVNGYWFPWNGVWNGGGNTTLYANSSLPDGPERFRAAYRHIVDVMRGEGASNIMWVFHLNDVDIPGVEWNRFETYYPGDSYVDWTGVSVYGAGTPRDDACDDFQKMMDLVYPRLIGMAPGKPITVLEFAVTSGNSLCDQGAWAREALGNLTSFRWPEVLGFSWWNEKWQNDNDPTHDTDMRVQDNPALGAVFRTFVGANPNVLGRVVINVTQTSASVSEPTSAASVTTSAVEGHAASSYLILGLTLLVVISLLVFYAKRTRNTRHNES